MDRGSATLIATTMIRPLSMILRIRIEHKVLNPAKAFLLDAQTISLADSPPPDRLRVADCEGLGAWLLLSIDKDDVPVIPAIAASIHTPFDNASPVC